MCIRDSDDAYSPGSMIELEKEDKDISVLFGDGQNETIVDVYKRQGVYIKKL